MNIAIQLAERGLVSDQRIRQGIRKLLAERLTELKQNPKTANQWVDELKNLNLAEKTEEANEQHYEIPAPYFQKVLGPHLKYSSGYWTETANNLEQSEAEMLQISCERAQLQDGQHILELGCGWGSLSLWMAANYPNSQITSISNSNSQREYITTQAKLRGLTNLKVITQDINQFKPAQNFDRIVSVEMFEHVRNHHQLFKNLKSWLNDGGKVFVHVFAHRSHAYLFEERSSKDWMSKYFFSGGIMPSADLLPTAAQPSLTEEARWFINGQHYSKTLEAWLQEQDNNRDQVMATFRDCYGSSAKIWFQRWRMFYLACSELFGYNGGEEWCVMHYRFAK